MQARSRADPFANTGVHLSPADFHAALLAAADVPTVVIDARNAYETAIGRFQPPKAQLLDPATRCFSDLPGWMDRHEGALRHRRVLMYCTGGVRCERASAYLKEKGEGFGDVYQLQGGIQRCGSGRCGSDHLTASQPFDEIV